MLAAFSGHMLTEDQRQFCNFPTFSADVTRHEDAATVAVAKERLSSYTLPQEE